MSEYNIYFCYLIIWFEFLKVYLVFYWLLFLLPVILSLTLTTISLILMNIDRIVMTRVEGQTLSQLCILWDKHHVIWITCLNNFLLQSRVVTLVIVCIIYSDLKHFPSWTSREHPIQTHIANSADSSRCGGAVALLRAPAHQNYEQQLGIMSSDSLSKLASTFDFYYSFQITMDHWLI